ncbi:MAG: DUF86 domain-containing protein [Oscillibacter sp.]|nr:DUF86 domain-containing protein [Oscillibacter sp.]
MREKIRDKERLEHMLKAMDILLSQKICITDTFISDNPINFFGIVKLVEIIGEAAYKLTTEFKASHATTPWRDIERMRHVLVHGYYQVAPDVIELVIKEDLPVLKLQIESYLCEM